MHSGAERLQELLDRREIPTVELGQEMGTTKEDGTLETEEKIVDPSVTSLA